MSRAWLLLLCGACSLESNLLPASGGQASAIEVERFARRLYLDLLGSSPGAADLSALETKLAGAGTAALRAAAADDLMTRTAFAKNYVVELEGRVFAGEQLSNTYQLICLVFSVYDPACKNIPPSDMMDQCSVDCASVKSLADERALLAGSSDDLAAGATTSTIERRYASAMVFRYSFVDQKALADGVWNGFLGRKAGADEERNASLMAYDLQDQRPKGVIFGKLGGNLTDLVDIVFSSEAYREAMVQYAFVRYLGRPPSPVELAVFADRVDAENPDLRPLTRAVVSSREYFAQ
jgi:hypothetical protein